MYDVKNQSKLKLSEKIEILNLIKEALSKKDIDLSNGGIINFFDRDGTLNIKNPELREAIQNAKEGNIVAGTLTGKLPEELSDVLKGFSFLGSAGGGMLYLPSIEKKIPFTIEPEKIKEVEKIYRDILKEYGINEDLIEDPEYPHLQMNSYEEGINQGMILLLSNNETEEKDYVNRGTSKERLLKALPEERYNRDIVEMTAIEGGEKGKEILEELYKRIQNIDGIKMVPPGFFGDRTGKHTGADITKLDKGDVFNIILDAYPDVIPHFMGNSTNDIPAVQAVWSRGNGGIVSMVMPPELEHDDTPLIALLSHYSKQYNKNLILVEPGPKDEFGSQYATEILKNPSLIGEKLKSDKNLENIDKYEEIYEEMSKNGKIPKSILDSCKALVESFEEEHTPMLTSDDMEKSVINIRKKQIDNIAQKLKNIADTNEKIKSGKNEQWDESEVVI